MDVSDGATFGCRAGVHCHFGLITGMHHPKPPHPPLSLCLVSLERKPPTKKNQNKQNSIYASTKISKIVSIKGIRCDFIIGSSLKQASRKCRFTLKKVCTVLCSYSKSWNWGSNHFSRGGGCLHGTHYHAAVCPGGRGMLSHRLALAVFPS